MTECKHEIKDGTLELVELDIGPHAGAEKILICYICLRTVHGCAATGNESCDCVICAGREYVN